MKKKDKSYNYKLVIGIIIGVLLSAIGVYATTTYASNDVYYINSNSSLSSTNVQNAIDELANKDSISNNTECPDGYMCLEIKDTLALGDYVSLTPTLTSATTDTTKTGYSSSQTFYPSELNLWRVISLNDDGTVDIISEYESSTWVYFGGLTGYRNLVGYLNELASKYENSTYTTGSRHFGYNGQTEYITADESTYFSNPAPYTADTSDNTNESTGGGDTLYQTDYNLVNSVLGTRVALTPSDSTTSDSYWMASRYYYYDSSSYYYWAARFVNNSGSEDESLNYLYRYRNSTFNADYNGGCLRPILTLKSGLKYSGLGTEAYPMEVSVS